MKCSKCGKDFPSIYYFKTDTVCIECFKILSNEKQQSEIYKQLMKHPMTTTTFTIEGYKVVKQLGVVRGITVRSRSIFGSIVAIY
jgi:DNA-directed RNA polymerase subunit RPC12/RpoP